LCDSRQVLGVSCGGYRRRGAFAVYVAIPSQSTFHYQGRIKPEEAKALPIAVYIERNKLWIVA
jgi:L-iditol 2-dehydrogenase